ncbi:hypothetical protein Bccel_2725 [Pseudobacteroides cellulosolvens ATCC 35603 = DSM 2933]|uniref:Uncharacterized protein n=2 Tax=Pseudobacteroides cellulosolvens TaxID=35825 RepID=A0A0L6JNU4_9FIRM|nr:hypothetical protein Bccel_2725 [Pseudobacteroides cellulosolvens ATCC 35603 = DSM 2933]
MLSVSKKALIYRDLKAIWGFALIIFIELVFLYNSNLIIDYGGLRLYSFKSVRNIIFLFFSSITLVIVSKSLFQFERDGDYDTSDENIPLLKKSFLGSKWLAGVLTITAAFALEYIVLNCVLLLKGAWTAFIHEVSIRYLAIYMMALFAFAFVSFLQSINLWTLKENLAAILMSIVPVSFLLVYYGQYSFFRSSQTFFSSYFTWYFNGFWDHVFLSILTGLFTPSGPIPIDAYIYDDSLYGAQPDILFATLMRCGSYLAVSMVLFLISWFFFGRIKAKNNNVSLLKSIIRFAAVFMIWVLFIIATAFIHGYIRVDHAI